MIKNNKVKIENYNDKDLYIRNGIPWPRIPEKKEDRPKEVPLEEIYPLYAMDFLDTEEAKPIFASQADLVIKHKIKGIIDVGCRIGRINDILFEKGYTEYEYMGFDTSPEPIEYAQDLWKYSNNIEYRVASFDNLEKIGVNFPVDCVIWSGVLLYRPNQHAELFKKLTVDFYNASHAIIQEPCAIQDNGKYPDGMELKTIDNELDFYKSNFKSYDEEELDLNLFLGRRKICHILL